MKSVYVKDMNSTFLSEPICAAIGNFDGVHLGHQKLIDESKRHGLKSAVLTFYPHPSVFLKKIPNYPLITPLEIKTDIIARLGVDYLIVVEFNDTIAQMPKDKFMKALHSMNIQTIVCGYDFTFSRRAEGSIRDLEKEFDVFEVKKYVYDDVRVSSTYIREMLSSGNVHEANKMLGRAFAIRGSVKYGTQSGRLIGFPTANIDCKNYYIPKTGVYYCNVLVNHEVYLGMCNIGHNPTFNFQENLRIEVHIFGLDADIYGEYIEIRFLERIRDEHKFDSVEELKKQLSIDKAACLELAGNMNYTK